MDFFEAQDEARSRTKLLVVYFAAAVLLIIAAVYLAVTAGVFFYHHKVGSPSPPALYDGLRLAITAGIVIPLIGLGSIWRITQLRSKGGAGVAEAMGGRKLDPSTRRPGERKLVNVVEEMAIASGMPLPGIYVMDGEDGINAFAAGFGFDDAVVAVTRGTLEQLNRDELQGVIAHEFSHILNGDMRLSTKLSGWIFGIIMLTLLGRGFWALIKGGGSGGRRRAGGGIYVGGVGRSRGGGGGNSKGGGGGALIIAVILVAVLVTIIGFIGEFFARMIQAAVSREREYLADASAVQFTRNPEGIGNALRRIGGAPRHSRVCHPSAGEFAHAFFSKSLRSEVSFLATHPPLKKRISRVLKDWQGDYLGPRPRPKPKKPEPTPTKERGHAFGPAIGPDGGGGGGGGGQFQQMLTAGLFMRSLGQLQEQGRAYAKSARERVQAALPEAFEDADRSPAVVLALLLQKDDTIGGKQRELLDEHLPDLADDATHYADQIRPLDRAERLILFEMMAARLPDVLLSGEREDFLACAEALAQADQTISTFELACLQLLRSRLFPESPEESANPSHKTIIHAARTLATRLAKETRTEKIGPGDILEQASRQAPYFVNQLHPVDATPHDAMEEALADLKHCPLGIRRQFLQICERIVAADEKASMNEVELLRAIAIGLGVPSAPIFPQEQA